jgi:hypothetical protein
MGDGPDYMDLPISVLPVCATVWPRSGRGNWDVIEDLTGAGLDRLAAAALAGDTIWIETEAEVRDESESQSTWLEGEYPVWQALPTPRLYWSRMDDVLAAVRLPSPALDPIDDAQGPSKLLRTLPFVYTRGAFGTVRDALFDDGVVEELQRAAGDDPLTAFPTAGFVPDDRQSAIGRVRYTVLHATFCVIGSTVVSVRLPDTFCPRRAGNGGSAGRRTLVPADVLTRFLPDGRTPRAREVAEAVGMHQATSARAVAARIRDGLEKAEDLARELNDDAPTERKDSKQDKPPLKEKVIGTAKTIDELAEIGHLLDRNLSTILRRFGDEISAAPAAVQALVPPEVKRRYEFALDNIHALHEDCRLASQTVRHELVVFEQSQREQFQFVSAALASAFLIPTLMASVLGVNLGIPGEHSRVGFIAFVVAIGGLALVGYSALKTAQADHWSPPPGRLRMHVGAAVAILVALVIALLLVS